MAAGGAVLGPNAWVAGALIEVPGPIPGAVSRRISPGFGD
jgi:hypothetical protein